MSDRIWWVHEKALFVPSHEVRCVHVWDEAYYQSRGYSLKRMVFIYESLCHLSVDIVIGDTHTVLTEFQKPIDIPQTADAGIRSLVSVLQQHTSVHWVQVPQLVDMDMSEDFPRFFRYWKQAQKTAFLRNNHD